MSLKLVIILCVFLLLLWVLAKIYRIDTLGKIAVENIHLFRTRGFSLIYMSYL